MHNDQILGGDVVSGGGIVIENQVAGDMIYYDGSAWVRVPKGITAQVLTMGAGVPQWSGLPGYPKYYPRFVVISSMAESESIRGGIQNDLGDVYVFVYGGSAYKMEGGIGTPVLYQTETINWGLGCYRGNDVYIIGGTTIYKLTDGVGSFVDLGVPSLTWQGMCSDGIDVYAAVSGGGIYKQTNGAGSFVAIPDVTNRAWIDITKAGDDLFLITAGTSGSVYKMTNATGDPVGVAIKDGAISGHLGIAWNPDKSQLYIADRYDDCFISEGGEDKAINMYTGERYWIGLNYNSLHKKMWTVAVDGPAHPILAMDLSV